MSTAHVLDEIAPTIADLRARLVGRFGGRLGALRLFGSWARGDHRADSDIDVLVVVEGLTRSERLEVFALAADLYFDHQRRVSPLALSPEEYRELVDREYQIAGDIAEQGIPL